MIPTSELYLIIITQLLKVNKVWMALSIFQSFWHCLLFVTWQREFFFKYFRRHTSTWVYFKIALFKCKKSSNKNSNAIIHLYGHCEGRRLYSLKKISTNHKTSSLFKFKKLIHKKDFFYFTNHNGPRQCKDYEVE